MMEKRAKMKIDTDKPIRKPAEPLPPWFESGRGTGFLTRRYSASGGRSRERVRDNKLNTLERRRRGMKSR